MNHQPGTVLFCESSTDEAAVENAKQYCAANGWAWSQVKIVRSAKDNMTAVIVR